jgi:hypothetical protein
MKFHIAGSLVIVIGILAYLWIFKICIYTAIAAHTLYPNSEYAVAANHKTGNYHAYLFINEVPKDPQTLFLYLNDNVDYYNPEFRTKSTSELLDRTYTWGQK